VLRLIATALRRLPTDTTMDKLIRRGIDLVLAQHKANRS
jgi:hypothetical protein